MSVPQVISFIVGGYAAIVATTALVWNILKERSKIELRIIAAGEYEYETDAGEIETKEQIELVIINTSYKPVVIKKVGINYGSYNDDWYELDEFVCQRLNLKPNLLAGDSQIWMISMEEVTLHGKDKPAKYIFVEDGRYKRYKIRIPKNILEC